ncbi:hypothetical protein F4Y93_00895 [Candidatus Poribacteria bacterium]|nr:hypothetical protein [Candidatus Poribacteria bacterium]
MYKRLFTCLLFTFLALSAPPTLAQHSVARQWNDALLTAISNDKAFPTIQARNLFHTSIALYDAWTVYGDGPEQTYLLGKTVNGFAVPFDGVPRSDDVEEARHEAMSYAAYRLIEHRFAYSPGAGTTFNRIGTLMVQLGYDLNFTSTDYASGNPAALGNYIAYQLIRFGLQDGANERDAYRIRYYTPLNPPLNPSLPGHNNLINPNFWQPLSLGEYDEFLTPEWGSLMSFALGEEDMTMYQRDGINYPVFHDPGPPPCIDIQQQNSERAGQRMASEEYQWGFALVAMWSSHLDPADGVLWNISPGAIGNAPTLPQTLSEYKAFYNFFDGGDASQGHPINPHTGQPYEDQWVPRADYARVLAEFWADGPSTETPPGHWFSILNYVSDHPLFEKRFKGQGPILDDLEWDVKAYLSLGGAMHDAAVSAWSIKSWYDYVRPISAVRWLADRGQSSDPALPRYDPAGLPLVEGYIELVKAGDPLAGTYGEHIDKIKLKAWRGPDYVTDTATDIAGVGWILAENWWPYQRSDFVTPSFAGYVSGHSVFSNAGARVLTLLTGDPFFPGGMGEFPIQRNRFLVFEEGPSVDVVLQWATYQDASDQSSLSRLWGGIHPPVDDIPARIIGVQVGEDAFALSETYFGQPLPWAPDAPVVTGSSAISVTVNWEALPAAIMGYDLRYRQGDTLIFTDGPQDVTGTSATITGLRPNTAYVVQVRGSNATGDGDWSDVGIGKTATPSVSLDVDDAEADQSLSVLDVFPERVFSIQVFGTYFQAIDNFSLRFEYDATQVVYEGFSRGSVSGTSALSGRDFVSIGMTLSKENPVVDGSLMGTIRFRTTEAFSGTDIRLMRVSVVGEEYAEVLPVDLNIALGKATPPSADFDGNGIVGISDFLLFVEAFGSREGQTQYDEKYDLDGNGEIGVSDFLIFVNAYGEQTS